MCHAEMNLGTNSPYSKQINSTNKIFMTCDFLPRQKLTISMQECERYYLAYGIYSFFLIYMKKKD